MNSFFKYKLDHILFWFATIFFHSYTKLPILYKTNLTQLAGEIFVRNGLLAIVVYVNFLLFMPRYLKPKRYIRYVVSVAALLGLYVAGKNLHDHYLYEVVMYPQDSVGFYYGTLYNFSIGMFYLAFSTTLLLSKDWFVQREELQQLRIENLNTELQYLKQQINPHFLFNTLNTIYFQINKENTEARDTLHKFSEMLRYPLYECNGVTVPLEKELAYMRHYVDLQKLRKDAGYQVEFLAEISDGAAQVYPLLMLPFVENAFKHSSHFEDKPNEIYICLRQCDRHLTLEVVNTKEKSGKGNESGGIGLANTRRRLELLYHDRFELVTLEDTDKYNVKLTLPI